MSESLTWKGDALTGTMRQAQKLGVNKTMGDCVVHAKSNHPWKNQTGILEGSIKIAEFAHDIENGVEGVWGSTDVKYARIHEKGGVIVPKNAKALAIPQPDGSVRFVKRVTIPKRPYLRPAADAKYPELPKNVKAAYTKLSASSAGPEA